MNLSPVRSSLRLHGAKADELPPLEEVERKARMIRSMIKKQNSPQKDDESNIAKDTLVRKANTCPMSNSGTKIGSSFTFKRNLSTSLNKKPVKKSIWGASGYRATGYRRRMRWRKKLMESSLVDEDEDGNNMNTDQLNTQESDIENKVEKEKEIENNCEETSDMETAPSLAVNVNANSPRSRHHSGGFSSGNLVNGEINSQKHSEAKCLSIDVDMSSPKEGQRSPCSLRLDSQRSVQKSPRSDSQRSPRSLRSEIHRSPQRSPHSDHLYAQQFDEDTQESPQRSFRQSSGQRSPRQSVGQKSPRRQESECVTKETNKTDQTGVQDVKMPKLNSFSETAQKDAPLQGFSQETHSQDKQSVRSIPNEVIVCDSGIGSSESSADSNDSTGKAKELLKAHEAHQDGMAKVKLLNRHRSR